MLLNKKSILAASQQMNKFSRFGLFVIDFLPLFVILLIRYGNPLMNLLHLPSFFYLILLVAFIVASFMLSGFLWRYLIEGIQKIGADEYEIIEYKNDASSVLSYLIPYIFGLINLNLNSYQDLAVLILLLILTATIYINSEVVFCNPLLYWFGYRIYRIQARRSIVGRASFNALCISKRVNFPLNQKIDVYELDKGVVFLPPEMQREQQIEDWEKDEWGGKEDDDP